MATTTTDRQASSGQAPTRCHRYKTPPGQRVIHVVVPEATFVHVHKMALESSMRFSHYLARFLEEAFPYPAGPLAPPSDRNQASDCE
jgi:hypothetical protein